MAHIHKALIEGFLSDCRLAITLVFYQNIDQPNLVHIKSFFFRIKTHLTFTNLAQPKTAIVPTEPLFSKRYRICISSFTGATSQQGCIVKVFNRPRDRPYIKRCSANGRRHCHMVIRLIFLVLCPTGVSAFTRLFDWLAISNGSLFPVFSSAVFRWVLPC